MISPELLRRYPFFGHLTEAQLKAIAMISEEKTFDPEMEIFLEGKPASSLYFLIDGAIDLYYAKEQANLIEFQKGIPVGEINPGEPFGISALIEPNLYTASALATKPSRVIEIDAVELRKLLDQDYRLNYHLTHQAAKAAIVRLYATRTQLAATWA